MGDLKEQGLLQNPRAAFAALFGEDLLGRLYPHSGDSVVIPSQALQLALAALHRAAAKSQAQWEQSDAMKASVDEAYTRFEKRQEKKRRV